MTLSITTQYETVKDLVSEQDFQDKIDKKYGEYCELITREVLAYLIACELGRNIYHSSMISKLVPDQETTIVGVISSQEPKFFDKKSKDGGQVVSLNISDTSGECRLVLWDYNHIELVKNGTIKNGTKLKIVNGKVKSTEYGLELHVTRKNLLIVDPVELGEHFLNLSSGGDGPLSFDNLDELESDQAVNTTGMITRKTAIRTFTRKNKSEGKVANLDLYDGTDTMRVTLWDAKTDYTTKFEVGDHIEIINGFTKLRNGTLEIYANYRTKIRKKV
jgi:replication factor A1